MGNFIDRLNEKIDSELGDKSFEERLDKEAEFLSRPAPNIIEWVTGIDYWNVASTFEHSRQYQVLRDIFAIRCPICNSNKPEDIDCWGKSRMQLESEVLFTWSEEFQAFICPKCKISQEEFVADGVLTPYNEGIIIAGMRSGKSFTGAHIGGYIEHFLSTRSVRGKGYLQRMLKQERSEWFEVTFAASTATQAQQTIYAKYREMRNNSPWVRRYTKWIKEREEEQVGSGYDKWRYRLHDDAILDGHAQVRYNRIASDYAGIAGKTRIMGSIDEWARLIDTEGTRSALELYRVLNQSLKTVRAARELHNLPTFLGLMMNVTSPLAQDDPAMALYNKAEAGELKRVYGWKGPTWEFNPQMPRHIFDEEYEKDPIGAQRDYGADPPNAEMPYVDDPLRFWKSIDWDRKPIAEFEEIHLTDKTGKSYVGLALSRCDLDQVNTYYLFGDAGTSWDAFGLVCAHPEWVRAEDLDLYEDEDGEGEDGDTERPEKPRRKPPARGRINPVTDLDVVFAEDMGSYLGADLPVAADGPMIREAQANRRRMLEYFKPTPSNSPYDHQGEMLCTVIDFAIRIVPTVERDVWYDSIVSIIEELRKRIRIAAISFDRWNSDSSIQQIRTMGVMATKTMLRPEHFMGFLKMTYNGRVSLLSPHQGDMVGVSDKGSLVIGTPQEQMQGQSVALVELLKLNRTPDLRKFHNPNKGKIRGRDSDDLARCYIGAHHLVQDSIVDEMANQKKRRSVRKRQTATDTNSIGTIFRAGRTY